MTMMTTQDRHNDEGRLALELYGPCPHGRPQGHSNYDVAFCGACEREMADEAAAELFLEDLDRRLADGLGYPFPVGPCRDRIDADDLGVLLGFDERRAPADTDLPF